jgi:hypothetical protein
MATGLYDVCRILGKISFGPYPNSEIVEAICNEFSILIDVGTRESKAGNHFPLHDNSVDAVMGVAKQVVALIEKYPDRCVYIYNRSGQREEALVAFAAYELSSPKSSIVDPVTMLRLENFYMVCQEPADEEVLRAVHRKARESRQLAAFWKFSH